MKKIKIAAAAAVIGLAVVCGIFAAGPSSTMSIKRPDDPVKVEGQALKALNGVPIVKMRLQVYKAGAFQPAPYQIDERNQSGEWVFTIGEEKETDFDGGKLDPNDELVFMARDMGDQAPAGAKPTGAGVCYSITATDPVDGGVGYAYICSFDNPPEPSKVDYASYAIDPQWMWMTGQNYKIGTGVQDSYFDKIMIKGAGGKWSPDLVDRYKTRGSGIPGLGTMPESNAKAKAVAWVDGPVRVIRKSKGWLKVAGILKIHGEGSSQNLYYPTFFEIPLRLGVPSVPKSMLKDFKLTITLDFNHLMYGAKYYDTVNKQGVVLDGVPTDAEKNLDRKTSHRWWLVTGPLGTVMARYVLSPQMDKLISTPAYYVDDKNALDPPDEEPGQSNCGLVMENFVSLPPGEYRYSAYYHFPTNFKWGEQDKVLNMLDKPLAVKVAQL